MKKDYHALFQHFEIREDRYKKQIEQLQNIIHDKDIIIAELKVQTQRLQGDKNRLQEQIDRLVKYSDTPVLTPNKPKKKFRWFKFQK